MKNEGVHAIGCALGYCSSIFCLRLIGSWISTSTGGFLKQLAKDKLGACSTTSCQIGGSECGIYCMRPSEHVSAFTNQDLPL